MCLKFSRTANRTPLASFLPFIHCQQDFLCAVIVTHVTRHENGPQQDTKHETIILEVYVVYNEETGVKEQGCRYNSLDRRFC